MLLFVMAGYITTQHGSSIPLQKQLEHANQQSGFNEEKYKLQQVGHSPSQPVKQVYPNMCVVWHSKQQDTHDGWDYSNIFISR